MDEALNHIKNLKNLKISGLLIGLTFMFLISCEKTTVGPEIMGPEPEPLFVLEKDSISEGALLGIRIGKTASEVYYAAQMTLSEHENNHLYIVRPGFSAVEEVRDLIPLYNSLYFDQVPGSSKGIQVYFENDRIQSIWTNDGKKLKEWPTSPFHRTRIKVGDPTHSIYTNLEKLSKVGTYSKFFERLTLSDKNVNRAFDPSISQASEWYFMIPLLEEQFKIYHLSFEEGVLMKIKWELMGKYMPEVIDGH
ncbi:MAG TPA: hypothetical protein VFD72_02450 [Sphingobacteriaceae bacterium]|nr:hypothetical protein [Sphingobacteriaceae bacterium]